MQADILSAAPVATAAAGLAIDTGHQGTTIHGILVGAGKTLALKDGDASGTPRFSVANTGGDAVWYPLAIKFLDDVYSSAADSYIYP